MSNLKSYAARFLLLIATILGLLSGTIGSAAASDNSTGMPSPAVAALNELKTTGQLSDQARATLLRYPEIAAQVADPASSEVGSSSTSLAGNPVGTLGCWITDAWVRKRTVLGFTAYVFHHVTHWCANGSAVTSVHVRYPYISENDGQNYYRGLISDWVGGTPAWYVESFQQANMENCVIKFGCISNSYPWVKIKMWGNDGWGYEAGV